MKKEGISELKELDRILQEHAAIKKERDELRGHKKYLERALQKSENKDHYLEEVTKERDRLRAIFYKTTTEERVTIGKTELETIIKQHFNYEEVKIKYVYAGPNIVADAYPSVPNMSLPFKMDIVFLKKREEEEGK